MSEDFPEVGTVYPSGIVETPEGTLNVPVGAVVDGVCIACCATGLHPIHEHPDHCPYLGAWKANPGRPRNPLRDLQERVDESPTENPGVDGGPTAPVTPDYGPH